MANKFASGKHSIAGCDRCGQRFKLKALKELVIKTKPVGLLVCPECWEPDHPQLQLGMYPVEDPQAVRDPRPDGNLIASRDTAWGWNPVGGGNFYAAPYEVNTMLCTVSIGTVTVSVS